MKCARVMAVAIVIAFWGHEAKAQPFLPGLRVDTLPTHQGRTFVLTGAVFDYDFVHVWAFLESGPVFLGGATADKLDRTLQRSTGGWELLVKDAPLGTYPVVVYAHDPVTDTFPLQWVQTFTVSACAKTTIAVRWIPKTFHSDPFSAFGFKFHVICGS